MLGGGTPGGMDGLPGACMVNETRKFKVEDEANKAQIEAAVTGALDWLAQNRWRGAAEPGTEGQQPLHSARGC